MKKKNLVITITVVTAISLGILTGCGAYTNSNAKGDPLMPSTTVESVVETEDETETTTQKPEETTTQKPDEAKDEKTERQNQDADPTEEADKETVHQSNDTKPSTTPHASQSTESTTQAHVHNFKTETYYTTETQTVHHDAITHTVHHDAVTHQETKYKTETIERDGYLCDDGAFFEDEGVAADYCVEHLLGYRSWTQRETVQVPYTETVVDQAAYDETVTDKPAWDETVEVQVAHTREVCSCGATK